MPKRVARLKLEVEYEDGSKGILIVDRPVGGVEVEETDWSDNILFEHLRFAGHAIHATHVVPERKFSIHFRTGIATTMVVQEDRPKGPGNGD